MADPFELDQFGGMAPEAFKKKRDQLEGITDEGPMEYYQSQVAPMSYQRMPEYQRSPYDRFMEGFNEGIRTIRDWYSRIRR